MTEAEIHFKGHAIYSRINFYSRSSPIKGIVRWSPTKSLWWIGMFMGWIVLGIQFSTISAVGVFLILCAVTLCLGHSIGMHRKLIHESFDSPIWVERFLVYLGTLVGLGGPFTMMRMHDTRDWAQRMPKCHEFLSHQQDIATDFWWQLHCKLYLYEAPDFKFPERMKTDRFYRFLQATSMLQQLPLALVLYSIGGWGWVAWGVCARVCVSIFGHWLVGYFAHNSGHRDWHLEGASVQGYNVRHLGLITFGECWHNNHHAFPNSAKLGHNKEQFDPGWIVLQSMQKFGLVWNLNTPDMLPQRQNLTSLKGQ